MIFSYGLTYGIGVWAGWEVSYRFLLLPAAAYMGILYGRKFAKARKIPIDVCFLVFIGGLLLWALFREPGRSYLTEGIRYFSEWDFTGKLEVRYGWLMLVFLLGIGEGIYRMAEKHIASKIGISMLALGFLVWQAYEEAEWAVLPAAALLFVCLEGLTEGYQRLVQKQKEVGRKEIWPFLFGAVLLVSICPVRSTPVSWDGVINFFGNAKETVNELLAKAVYGDEENEFGVGTIGFSADSDSFWGRLVDSRGREMMKISVYTGSGTAERYFAGVIKDIYEEDNWSEADSEEEEIGDLQEHLFYLYQSGLIGESGEQFCQSHTYSVQYQNLRTGVLFYPANSYRISAGGRKILHTGSNLTFAEKQGRGDMYQISGLSMNLENKILVEYLRSVTKEKPEEKELPETEEPADESFFEECVRRMGLSEEEIAQITEDVSAEEMEERAEGIRSLDLQLPDNLSEEVRKLANDLTKGIDNEYDKVQAIIRYLKEDGGFTYSTVPTELPEGKTVMDYFLFESREGYCTYYATALVLLCRCAGIPARYVEGIVVDYESEEEGWYPVWGRNSHAWTQVYLTGFGWLDVDATPGRERSSGNWRNIADNYQQSHRPDTQMGAKETDSMEEAGTETVGQGQDSLGNLRQKLRDGLILLAGAAGILLLVLLIGRGMTELSYRRAGRRKQTEILMRRLLHCLKKRDLGIKSEETLRMYKKRLNQEDEGEKTYLDVFDWYEGVRYGGRDVTKEDILWLEQICRTERKQVRRFKRKVWMKRRKRK